MKLIIIVACVFCSVFCFSQQNYKVVHVLGSLEKDVEHKELKLGDELRKKELLSVKGAKVNCLLFNGSERMTFKNSSQLSKGSVEDLFAMVPERQMIGSRGDNDSAYLKVGDFFKNERYLFLDSTEQILLNKDYIKDLGNNKFIIVDSDDRKALIKFENSKLNLEAKDIFKGEELEKKIKIYSINSVSGVFVNEAEVIVSRISPEIFKEQSKLVIDMLDPNLEESEKIKKSYFVLEEIYGGLNYQKWASYYSSLNK